MQVRNPPRPPVRENEIVVNVTEEVRVRQDTQTQRVPTRRRGGRRRWRRDHGGFTRRNEGRGRRRQPRRRRRGGRRDPLAQSFTVNESGAFLTSFDVYFASKDETAKLTVQLATMELGIPTRTLVQDFTEIVLSPDDINISNDASVPTTIKFPSPVYLPPDEEYALIFLCPSSDTSCTCQKMGIRI